MNCDQARELISTYIEGGLDHAQKVEFVRHLNTCSECAREAESLTRIWPALGELDLVEPSQALHNRIMTRLTELEENKRSASHRVSFWDFFMGRALSIPRRTFAVASVLLMMLLASSSFIPAGRNWISALVTPGLQREMPACDQGDISISVSPTPQEGIISTLNLKISPEQDVVDAKVKAELIEGMWYPGNSDGAQISKEQHQEFNWHVNLRRGEYTAMSMPLEFANAGMRTLKVTVLGNKGEYRAQKMAFLPIRSRDMAKQKISNTSIYLDAKDTNIYQVLGYLSATTKTPMIMEADLHGRVDLSLEGASLSESLDQALTPLGYTWNPSNRTVYIIRDPAL